MQQQQAINADNRLHLQLLQQTIARPAEGRCNVKLPSFNASRPEEYSRFEQAARSAVKANNWQWPAAGHAIVSALEGTAMDMARSTKPEDYTTLEDFFTALRELFLSPSFKKKARAEFVTRIQRPGEDIAVFHGLLKDLWERAYESHERVESYLIDQFIAGISHSEANKQLHMENAAGRLPTDYKGVLVRALGVISACQLIAQEEQRRAAGGQVLMDSSYQHPAPVAPPVQTQTQWPAPVPMEIGAVTGRNKWCEFHRLPSHNTQECYGKKGMRAPSNRQWTRPPQGPPMHNPRVPDTQGPPKRLIRNSNCDNCGGIGHWRNQCPSSPQPRTNQRGGNHQTNAVTNEIEDTTNTNTQWGN